MEVFKRLGFGGVDEGCLDLGGGGFGVFGFWKWRVGGV